MHDTGGTTGMEEGARGESGDDTILVDMEMKEVAAENTLTVKVVGRKS